MPNIKSAKKRVKVIAVKSLQNKAAKSNLKTVVKKAELAIENSSENKEAEVKLAMKKLDQAAAKGLLHKNCAAHKKSNLQRKLNQVG